jgi:integrating conjugative element protein (TIGR03757 family)
MVLVHVAWAGDLAVEVFTDRTHPLTNTEALPDATVYHIDRLVRMQEKLSEGLPADEKEAARIAKQRMGLIDTEAVTQAAQGLAIAHLKYQLDRYPAIVIDGRFIIYGVTDLALARRLYEESGREKP